MCTSHYIISGETLRFVYLPQESFLDSVLISASIPVSSISSSGTHIIPRLNSEVFCVSHHYLSFCFYLLPLLFGEPHPFILRITGSVFNSVDFCSLLSPPMEMSILLLNFHFLSTLSYSTHLPFHLMHFLFNLVFFINFLLLVNRDYVFLTSYRRR